MTAPSFLRDRLQAAAQLSRATIVGLEQRAQSLLGQLRQKSQEAHEVGRARLGGASTSDWLQTAQRVGTRMASQLKRNRRPDASDAPESVATEPVLTEPARPAPTPPMAQSTSLWARLRRLWHHARS